MAKLLATQLSHWLQKPIANWPCLWVVSGDEWLLANEALDLLRQAAYDRGFVERQRITLEQAADIDALRYALQAGGLFAHQRVIELHIPNGKPGKAGAEAIVAAIEKIDATLCIIVRLPKLDWSVQQADWVTALEKKSFWVSAENILRAQLPSWIESRAKKRGLTIESDASHWLAEQVEGNLLAAAQEIEKLSLLFPHAACTLSMLQSAVVKASRYDVFELPDVILGKDSALLARMLSGLQSEAIAPQLVLWTMSDLLNQLQRTQAHPASNAFQLRKLLHVREARARSLELAIKRFSSALIREYIQRAALLDRASKGVHAWTDAVTLWDQLTALAMDMHHATSPLALEW